MHCPGRLTAGWQLSIPWKGAPGLRSPDSSLTRGSEGSQALSTGWAHFLCICGSDIPEKTLTGGRELMGAPPVFRNVKAHIHF